MRLRGGKRKKAKLVVCDGSRSYRKAQLSLLTAQLISGYCGAFTEIKSQCIVVQAKQM